MITRNISRRSLLTACAALAGVAAPAPLKIAVFSKHLQFLKGASLAEGAAEIGFDGIDLTVRKGGHIEPERVALDLPPLAAIIRSHGLELRMITTDVVFAETPYAEDILKTMAKLDIRYYRWGGMRYVAGTPLAQQLTDLRPRVEKLAALNARYGVCAMYHTHSGVDQVGGAVWDLHELLNGLDPASVSINYDIAHATIEGGLGGWLSSFRIAQPQIRGVAVKDFIWREVQPGQWRVVWKPLGQGMVKLQEFCKMVVQSGFSGPLQMHFEYPLGGAEVGDTILRMPREGVFQAMRKDLLLLRSYLV
jgi:sugar phosphate isomerase/epimerase